MPELVHFFEQGRLGQLAHTKRMLAKLANGIMFKNVRHAHGAAQHNKSVKNGRHFGSTTDWMLVDERTILRYKTADETGKQVTHTLSLEFLVSTGKLF